MTDFTSRRLEIDALRALWAIRHHGGITRAAEALGLSQSAVSHKIKRLETSLDCDLLSRKPGASMFTAAGEDLLDYAGRILSLHDEALLSLSKTSLAGRVALGLTEDTTCTDLARILGRFRRLHPNVSVRTKVRMSLILRGMLERGELDAAIVQVFEVGERYSELEVNALLRAFHDDVAALRRYLVDEGFLSREQSVYWRTGGTVLFDD